MEHAALPARLAMQHAATIKFSELSAEQLPEVIREAEAEHQRRGGWQRVLPCSDEPSRYLHLFQNKRASNLLLSRYFSFKQNMVSEAASEGGSLRVNAVKAWR